MPRFATVLLLFGTLTCSVLASDPESKRPAIVDESAPSSRVDSTELREAAERYAREHPGGVPDLRYSGKATFGFGVNPDAEFRGYSARSGRPGRRCASCERDQYGRIRRSPEARRQFRAENPCPSTGKTTGACPGYVIDHVIALKRGGADTPENMQWQSRAEAAAKDRWE